MRQSRNPLGLDLWRPRDQFRGAVVVRSGSPFVTCQIQNINIGEVNMTRFRFSESGVKPEQIVDGQVEVWFYIDVQERPVLLHPESESEDGSYTVAISRDFLRFQADFYKLTDLEKIGANECIFHGFLHGEEVVHLEVPITLAEIISQGEFVAETENFSNIDHLERPTSTDEIVRLSDLKQGRGVTTHRISQRRSDSLTSVIEVARLRCANPDDAAQVWVQLEELALSGEPPLLDSTTEGIRYGKNGAEAYLTRAALHRRIKRIIKNVEKT